MMLSPRIIVTALAALLAASVAHAETVTELLLSDGSVLECDKLKLEEENYLVTLKDGEVISLPVELVETVRLTGTGEPPTGIRVGEAETLVGPETRSPRPEEQVEALGPPAAFRKDLVDNRWQPSTDWEMDPDKQNNFAPSSWPKNLIEPVWRPKSAWEANDDVLAPGRTQWRRSVIDTSWAPSDGFSRGAQGP